MNIVITSPHCPVKGVRPPSDDGHPFDIVAGNCARMLVKTLKDYLHNTALHVSDTQRDTCDLNRHQCRRTAFRKRVRRNFDVADLVLDVHSFPRDHANLDLYLFDNHSNWDKEREGAQIPNLGIELVIALVYNGISATYMPNVERNDIICEAAEYGIRGFLIEFNEDLSTTSIKKICNIIANWLNGDYRGIDLT